MTSERLEPYFIHLYLLLIAPSLTRLSAMYINSEVQITKDATAPLTQLHHHTLAHGMSHR
jgi:hypothetical protein